MKKILKMPAFANNTSAFTMAEFLIATIVLGLIAGFAVSTYGKAIERSHLRQARLNLRVIHSASLAFRAKNGDYPNFQCGSYALDCKALINTNLGINIIHDDMLYSYNFKNGAYPDTDTFTAEVTRAAPFYSLQVTNDSISATNPTWCEGNSWP